MVLLTKRSHKRPRRGFGPCIISSLQHLARAAEARSSGKLRGGCSGSSSGGPTCHEIQIQNPKENSNVHQLQRDDHYRRVVVEGVEHVEGFYVYSDNPDNHYKLRRVTKQSDVA